MLSKNQIKYITSLQDKKFRIKYGMFVAEGEKIISELVHSPFFDLESIYTTSLLSGTLSFKNQEIITSDELLKISGLATPNRCLAVFKIVDLNLTKAPRSNIIIAFDKIRDPGNLGTVIRTADWFGISTIICSEDSVDLFNPKVVQASMGSIARVQVVYQDLLQEITQVKKEGYSVYAADLSGQNIEHHDFHQKQMIIFGNEANGLTDDIRALCDDAITIPKKGGAESLNVSISAAIVMSRL